MPFFFKPSHLNLALRESGAKMTRSSTDQDKGPRLSAVLRGCQPVSDGNATPQSAIPQERLTEKAHQVG